MSRAVQTRSSEDANLPELPQDAINHLGILFGYPPVYPEDLDSSRGATRVIAKVRAGAEQDLAAIAVLEKRFDPRQLRDWRGRWARQGGGDVSSEESSQTARNAGRARRRRNTAIGVAGTATVAAVVAGAAYGRRQRDPSYLSWGPHTPALPPPPKDPVRPAWRPMMSAEEADEYVRGTKLPGARFHGTVGDTWEKIFRIGFSEGKEASKGGASAGTNDYGPGFYATSNPHLASLYAHHDPNGKIIETRVLAKNPMPSEKVWKYFKEYLGKHGDLSLKEAQAALREYAISHGYDSIHMTRNPLGSPLNGGLGDEIVVFSREQIVSVKAGVPNLFTG